MNSFSGVISQPTPNPISPHMHVFECKQKNLKINEDLYYLAWI